MWRKKRSTISIQEFLKDFLNWIRMNVEMNKQTFRQISWYKWQTYIWNEDKLEVLDFEWIKVTPKIKYIYLK